jgi:hypothetical protein
MSDFPEAAVLTKANAFADLSVARKPSVRSLHPFNKSLKQFCME